jgi:prephenate dehydratase
MRVAYLGPPGTFTEDALRTASAGAGHELSPAPSVYAAISAVESGEADRAFVPFENSIEGAVRATLDTLAFEAEGVALVGEHDFPISHCLIAREEIPLESIEVVLSHPQGTAQCARFLREELPGADVRAASSTAEAVRIVSSEDAPWAALGAASAADLYGCTILRDGVEDEPDNVTRFVWVAPEGTEPGDGTGGPEGEAPPGAPWRTSLIFAELGDDRPGALVDALQVFSSHGVNLTRIESRPRPGGLGRYMFFVDLEGGTGDEPVSSSISGLRDHAESVRVLGSYPIR